MGATAARVQAGILTDGIVLAVVGIGAGVAVSVGLARVASRFVFGLGWLDPATFAGVIVLLGSATVLASWIPARRVLAVDPTESMRAE
jgi:ABC-type antimicrobial peptide transport system permease subunit